MLKTLWFHYSVDWGLSTLMSDPLEPSVFYESIIENTKTVVWNIRVYLTIRLYQIQRTVFNVLNRKHIKRVLLLYLEKEN